PRHALFVPSLIKPAFSSQHFTSIYHTIGKNQFVQIPAMKEARDKVYKLRRRNEEMEFIPEQRTLNTSTFIYLGNEITKDGIYDIVLDDEVVGIVAMNFDRSESEPDVYTAGEIQELLEEYNLTSYSLLKADTETFKKVLKENEEGIRLWKLFIIL